jgi:hypothetical protein
VLIAEPETRTATAIRSHSDALAGLPVRSRGTDTRAGKVGNHECAMGVGETTDQLRTTMAELSAHQRSTMDTSDK